MIHRVMNTKYGRSSITSGEKLVFFGLRSTYECRWRKHKLDKFLLRDAEEIRPETNIKEDSKSLQISNELMATFTAYTIICQKD